MNYCLKWDDFINQSMSKMIKKTSVCSIATIESI